MLTEDKPRYPRKRMRVVQQALENAILVRELVERSPDRGDLDKQMLDSSRSVADNLGEAEGSIYLKVKRRCLDNARRENYELAGLLVQKLRGADHPLHDLVNHVAV